MENNIKGIHAYEILDSRGNPTVEAEVILQNGITATASVPSGASVGRYEAVELRDGDQNRYHGKGVLRAAGNIESLIAEAIAGMDATDQTKVDQKLIELDGTPNKSGLGANAILAVSLAVARAGAAVSGVPLYRYIVKSGKPGIPIPMMNVLNGGAHASNNVDIQEFMIVPTGAKSFAEALRCCAETYATLKKVINDKGLSTSVGDEGGFAPSLGEDAAALELLLESSERAGYRPGRDIAFAIDAAVSDWYAAGEYKLPKSGKRLSNEEMCGYWESLTGRYPIISLEDGMAQDDPEGWKMLTQRLGGRIQLVGDDLFVTNTARIREGIGKRWANSVLIKPNQIGTLSETLEAIRLAGESHYSAVISHRSGETEDPFIADLAVASGCGQIKSGAPARAERTAKYNRLLRIAREAGTDTVYLGASTIRNYRNN